MFDNFFSFNPSITQTGSYYLIQGIVFKDLEIDLKNTFGTSVIANKLLIRLSNSRFKVHQFFMVEFAYLLDNIINTQNNSRQRFYRVNLNKYRFLYEEVKTKTWIKSTLRDYDNIYDINKALKGFKFKPFPGQLAFLEHYASVKYGFQLKGILLDSAAGTGKTVTSLMWSRMLPGKKTIILVLKHLIDEPWLDHIKPEGNRYCFTSPPKVWVSTSNDDPRKSDAEYFIFYKEQLRKDDWKGITFASIISALSGNGTTPLKMIIDEAHNYNDIDSQQTQGAVAIGSHPYITDVLSMSGTPIKSAGRETYPLFCMIDKFFDKTIRPTFLKLYSRNNEALNELLAHRLGRIKFTINAIDGLGDPPEPVPLPVSFPGVEKYTLTNIRSELIYYIQERAKFYQKEMPNYLYDYKGYIDAYQDSIEDDPTALSELAVYRKTVDYFKKNGFNTFVDTDKSKFCKQVEEKIEANLKGEDLKYFRHIVPAVKYLPLKIKGEALGNVLGKARINAVVDLINHVDLAGLVKSGIKKTAIYSTYIEAINTAVAKLQTNGCNPVKYHSQDKMSITEVISKLRDAKTDSIVTSFDSLSEGQPLLECNQLVLLNLPWRDYILKQTIARIFRKGQDTECFVWSLFLDTGGEDNITTRTQDIVEYFKDITDQILNGGLGFDNISGVSLKLVDDTKYDFASLVPFDIPVMNFRPKFLERTFTSMFR